MINQKDNASFLGYFREMESKLIALIRRTVPTRRLLLTIDQIENMVLSVGLELIRHGLNVHTRGIFLGTADRLDHMVNMIKASIEKDVLLDCSQFADVEKSVVTAWNDKDEDKMDCLRSHLVHVEMNMQIGHGVNAIQKRTWNGEDTEGLRNTRRMRVIKLNDDLPIKFMEPVFNIEKGTYDLSKALDVNTEELGLPLIPMVNHGIKPRRVFIR